MSALFLALSLPAAAGTPADDAHWIINGADPAVDQFQNAGALILDANISMFGPPSDMRSAICTSTLIAPDTVLLAAHCLDDAALTMGFGTVNSKAYYWSRQADLSYLDGDASRPLPADAVAVADYVAHEGFDINALTMGLSDNKDIALVFLAEPVLDVEPALLPTPEEALQIVQDSMVDVVGWGQQTATNGMFEAPPPGTVGIKKWGQSYISELAPYEMKIGEVQTDVRKCHGDSGGPSFMTITTESIDPVRVIGVTSHAYDDSDCNTTGGVDTRVDFHLAWIEQQMASRCEAGTRVWCDVPGIIQPAYDEGGGVCGCNASGGSTTGGLLGGLLGALLLVRRRRA